MSDIFPYDNFIKFIPKDNPTSEGIYPVEYWSVTEENINLSGNTQAPFEPLQEGVVRIIEITGPPSSISPNEGSPITFSADAVITNTDLVPNYQWEKLESNGVNWTTISGATSSSYTTANLVFDTDYLDQYRCIVSSPDVVNSPATSNSVTLNVRRVITITNQPIIANFYYSGETATFNISAIITSGTINYQWQRKDFEQSTYTSISGATGTSYTTPVLNLENDNLDTYRCVLTNLNADPKISNELVLNMRGADIKVTPAVGGIRFWSFSTHGALILDPSASTTYEIECLQDNKNIKADMWGQGSCNATGGYSGGFVPLTVGSKYTVKLNAGGGTGGNAGGGYAGIFDGTTVSQASSLLIAGGAGGGGASSVGSCVFSGGTGGGNIAGNGTNASTNTTGGTGGTQSAGGTGGIATSTGTVTNTFSTVGTHTITIPSGATNLTYEIVGGTGGTGGTGVKGDPVNETYPGGSGGRGQKIIGILNPSQVSGQTLSLRVAGNGGNGSSNYFGASGGSAGSGLNSGGSGGSTPVSGAGGGTYYGASGGGGGGLSSISIGTTRLLIAGGGGGGGGGMKFSLGLGVNGRSSTTISTTLNASNGGSGGIPSDSFNSAGGGGGAGSAGGSGGDGSQAGNSIAGEGGSGGDGYRNPTYVTNASALTASTNAYVTITYTLPVQNGTSGTPLQGGVGGVGIYTGGGGGGGYFGGGGGGGNALPDESSGGGGGSGFVSVTVSGTTSGFVSTVSGVTRGTAGDINGNSRIVLNLKTITITQQPSLLPLYFPEEIATMTVAATMTGGGVISYEWQRKLPDNDTWTTISGATSNTYVTPALTLNEYNLNSFRCVLSNINAVTVISNEILLTVSGADLKIFPALNGKTFWKFSDDGALILDGANASSYAITPLDSTRNKLLTKMWGQGTCNAAGGYSFGYVPIIPYNNYTTQLNAGAGGGGQSFGSTSADPGGGYAGIFDGATISQATALLIAGGAGGAGRNAGGCERNGGNGGGSTAVSGQSSDNSEACAQGGGGGSQSSGGSGGSGCGYNDIWGSNNVGFNGSALQGGRGGLGDYNLPYTNAPGGGGGGGGYWGGGGGAGGNDYGNGTRSGGGGGGGSGFVAVTVVSGTTSSTPNLTDVNRGSAGTSTANSRIVIDPVFINITSQPNSIVVNQGSAATFSIVADISGVSGQTIQYQWQTLAVGQTIWNNISGATSSSYSKPNVSYANDHNVAYRCVLSNTYAGTVISTQVYSYVVQNNKVIFTNTGTSTYTLSNDIRNIKVKMWGSGGAGFGECNNSGFAGGTGGFISFTQSATSGQIVTVNVGATGNGSDEGQSSSGAGRGGEYSSISIGSTLTAVVGGGGGAGQAGFGGGGGGNGSGRAGTGSFVGQAGTQSAGGVGGSCLNCSTGGGSGAYLYGGAGGGSGINQGNRGGGGGSGYYGGGGGGGNQDSTCTGGGGGGGSGYVINTATNVTSIQGVDGVTGGATAVNNSDVDYVSGKGGSNQNGLVVLELELADISISPQVSGKSFWSFQQDGALVLDGATSTTYTITVLRSFSKTVKMWGQGSTNGTATGGYSTGTVAFSQGSTYQIRLNAGSGGNGAGGYAGMFISSVSQANTLLIAGGAGGNSSGGSSTNGTPGGVAGGGGGSSGADGTNGDNSRGNGATQSAGGTGGSGGFLDNYSSAAAGNGSGLQGGYGGPSGIGYQSAIPSGFWYYYGTGTGGGGGGGYWGGGGGTGGTAAGNGATTDFRYSPGGGGGGSGYVNATYVTGGSTSTFADSGDVNRGSAGNAGSSSRIVIKA